jgi:hypothetical protein
MYQLDRGRQDMLYAMAIDGVGVATAHFHELEGVVTGQRGDLRHQRSGRRWVPVLVDESHDAGLRGLAQAAVRVGDTEHSTENFTAAPEQIAGNAYAAGDEVAYFLRRHNGLPGIFELGPRVSTSFAPERVPDQHSDNYTHLILRF